MTKQAAMKALNEMPQKFELDQLLERLIFMDKVQRGIDQADKGEVISHEKVVRSMKKKWS